MALLEYMIGQEYSIKVAQIVTGSTVVSVEIMFYYVYVECVADYSYVCRICNCIYSFIEWVKVNAHPPTVPEPNK